MSYFKDAKVGDRVYDLVYGEGKIIRVNICPGFETRPITVEFIQTCCDKKVIEYALNGKHSGHYENQRLFYYNSRPILLHTEGVRMYFSSAVIGDKVWDYVWNEGKIIEILLTATSDMKRENSLLRVSFDNFTDYYMLDGKKQKLEHNQRLFYYAERPLIISAGCNRIRLKQLLKKELVELNEPLKEIREE